MSRTNVLFLIRSWAFGGSHTIVLLLMEHLPKDKFNVICVPYDAHTTGDQQFIAQAEKFGLSVAPERVPWKSRSNWSRARGKVLELIHQYDIQLVHTHDPHSNTMLGIGRSKWPCACVASAYGWWDTFFPVRRRIYQRVERDFALPHFDRVITVSQHMKQRILRGPTPEDHIAVIHTGIDATKVSGGDRNATRDRLGIGADRFVIGTVSRLSVEKGHKYLIEAIASLRQEIPAIHLLIVGDGPIRDELEKQVEQLGLRDRVTFAGFFNDLPGALAAMDLFAQPSIEQEGFPTSVLEAQAAGLPVVASDIGGTKETLNVGHTGWLATPKNIDEIKSRLRQVHALASGDPSIRERCSQHITSKFRIEDMIQSVSSLYQQLL